MDTIFIDICYPTVSASLYGATDVNTWASKHLLINFVHALLIPIRLEVRIYEAAHK